MAKPTGGDQPTNTAERAPLEAREKIEHAVNAAPDGTYRELFPNEYKELMTSLIQTHKPKDWDDTITDLLLDALGNEEQFTSFIDEYINSGEIKDRNSQEVAEQIRQYKAEIIKMHEDVERRGKETPVQDYYNRAVAFIQEESADSEYGLRQEQYRIAQKYLNSEIIERAEEKALASEIYGMRNAETVDLKNLRAADILDSNEYPNALREDDVVIEALSVLAQKYIDMVSRITGTTQKQATARMLLRRIHSWWPHGTDDKKLDFGDKREELDEFRTLVTSQLLKDQRTTSEMPGIEDKLKQCGLIVK